MTLKGSINVATATLIVISVLFAFFTWSSKSWIDGVNTQFATADERYYLIAPKIAHIETESSIRWAEMDRRLSVIDKKLDALLDSRGRP